MHGYVRGVTNALVLSVNYTLMQCEVLIAKLRNNYNRDQASIMGCQSINQFIHTRNTKELLSAC